MKLGIYLNSQYPDNEDASTCYQDLVEQVSLARSLGFDSVWAGEHHLTPGYHFFPQLPLLSNLAAHGGQMTLGTNLLLLPLHRPVDVAEQVAFIDIACGGRFILTIGQGYRREEFAALGVPFEERMRRMVEGVEIIRRLWNETGVDYEGSWFSLQNATVRPGPFQAGGPPIWMGATTDSAIRRAATLGDAFMATPNAVNADIRRQVEFFHAARRDASLQPARDIGRMLEVHCHSDGEEARRRARPHLLEKYAAYASWGLTGSAGAAAKAAGDANSTDAFAELARDRFVIGDPDEVVDGLVNQHRQVGMTHLAMRLAWPGSEGSHAIECIELLGREVLPRVRAQLRRT